MPKPDARQAVSYIDESIQLARLCLLARNECRQYSGVVDAGAVRALTIIGELIKLLPPETREIAPEIPFKEYAGMHDILMHKPWDINQETVWDTIEHNLSVLESALPDISAALQQTC